MIHVMKINKQEFADAMVLTFIAPKLIFGFGKVNLFYTLHSLSKLMIDTS